MHFWALGGGVILGTGAIERRGFYYSMQKKIISESVFVSKWEVELYLRERHRNYRTEISSLDFHRSPRFVTLGVILKK
jgi:hypothetical protein